MFVVFALGFLSMAAAQPPAQLSIPNVRVFTGARVIDRATITVADGKILSPQQPTRLFQSLDHDDSEPILKTRVVNAFPADGWRFSKPPPFSPHEQRSASSAVICGNATASGRRFVVHRSPIGKGRFVLLKHNPSKLNWKLEAPPGFEPGMEVLQTGPGCLSCCFALLSDQPYSPAFPGVWARLFPNCSQRRQRRIQLVARLRLQPRHALSASSTGLNAEPPPLTRTQGKPVPLDRVLGHYGIGEPLRSGAPPAIGMSA